MGYRVGPLGVVASARAAYARTQPETGVVSAEPEAPVGKELVNTWERLVPDQLASDAASQRVNELHQNRYQWASAFVKGKRIADIACGAGYGSRLLAEAGAASTLGFDLCHKVVAYADERYGMEGLRFAQSDADAFDWDEQFDVVISFETIEHLKEPEAFLSRVFELVEPGGLFLLSVPLGETRHLDPFHLHAFSERQVLDMVTAAGFRVEEQRLDELFLSWLDLLRWRTAYPDAPNARVGDLLSSKAGWKVIFDCIFKGGVNVPSIVLRTSKPL